MKRLEFSNNVINELNGTLGQLSEENAENFANTIIRSKRIFSAGAGRSGLMMKAFTMRLMHLGFDSYVVGETVTPSIEKGDLLIIGSGSGETDSLISMANKARNIGTEIALVTIFPESTIGKLANVMVEIPASTPKLKQNRGVSSIQPMGSLFEQSLLLFMDVIVLKLMKKRGIDSDAMFRKHANLE